MSEIRRYPMPATVYWDGSIERDATLTPKKGNPAHPRVDMVLASDHERIVRGERERAELAERERDRLREHVDALAKVAETAHSIFGCAAVSVAQEFDEYPAVFAQDEEDPDVTRRDTTEAYERSGKVLAAYRKEFRE